jgi:hypothetical protein
MKTCMENLVENESIDLSIVLLRIKYIENYAKVYEAIAENNPETKVLDREGERVLLCDVETGHLFRVNVTGGNRPDGLEFIELDDASPLKISVKKLARFDEQNLATVAASMTPNPKPNLPTDLTPFASKEEGMPANIETPRAPTFIDLFDSPPQYFDSPGSPDYIAEKVRAKARAVISRCDESGVQIVAKTLAPAKKPAKKPAQKPPIKKENVIPSLKTPAPKKKEAIVDLVSSPESNFEDATGQGMSQYTSTTPAQ